MKKLFTVFALILTAIVLVFSFAACSTSGHVLPTFVSGNDEYTIEHINNMDRSYVLYSYSFVYGGATYNEKIELNQDEYVQWGSISFAWQIKKGEETVGFIMTSGGSQVDNKDKTKYSYGFNYDNASAFVSPVNIGIYLIGKDADYMQSVTLDTNCGSLEVSNVNDYDIPGLAVKSYAYDLSSVKPKDANITFTLTIS